MAHVIEFPTEDVQSRARIERLLRDALESHEPETRAEKLRAIIEIFDWVSTPDPISITLNNPEGEPFTEKQIASITAGMEQLREECGKRAYAILGEVVRLKLQVIDLQMK